jgi:hypothetical protein
LRLGEHTEGAADFEAERGNAANHFEDLVEFPPLGRIAPGSTHAEAGYAAGGGIAGYINDVLGVEQALAIDTGVIVGALRAIGAIFGAAAGLDGEQLASLDAVRGVKVAMNGLSTEEEVR